MQKTQLKVAIILPSLSNKGPISVAKDIANQLIDKTKLIKVFYFDDIVELNFDCEVERISFFKKIRLDNFDVVHTHGLRPDLYLSLHGYSNIRKITTLHSNLYEDLGRSHGKIKGLFFAKIWILLLSHDKIVVLSDFVKKFYSNKIRKHEERLVRIYNGRNIKYNNDEIINKVHLEKINELRDSVEVLLGSVSVLNVRKGIDQIIQILENKKLGALIIGDGPEKDNLENLAKELNVDDRILFLGYQSNPYIFYKYFDVFVLTSHSEGFPLSLLEAIQMNKVCVVSDLPIYEEMFEDELELYKYRLNDITDFNTKIELALNNKEILVSNALNRVINNYSVEIMASKYLSLYEGK